MQLANSLISSLLLSVLLFVVTGCETVPDIKPLKISANRVVVLHVESLHKELKEAASPVYQELIKNIEKKGFLLASLSDAEYERLREEALVISGSVYDPTLGRFIPLDRAAYIKAVIDISARRYSYDVVLIPEIVLRTASIAGDNAQWDGIERKVSFVDQPVSTYRLPKRIKGLSLRLAAYTPSAAKVFLEFGGISLPYHLRYSDEKITMDLKKEFFNKKEIKEGVNLALEPFYQQVDYSGK